MAFCSVLAAISFTLLAIGSAMPPSRLSMMIAASLLPFAVIVRCGPGWGGVFYASTGLLAFLLVPDKAYAIPYVLCFGPYALVRLMADRIGSRILGALVKLAYMNACLAAMYFITFKLLAPELPMGGLLGGVPAWALLAAAQAAFAAYDLLCSKAIRLYDARLRGSGGMRRG